MDQRLSLTQEDQMQNLAERLSDREWEMKPVESERTEADGTATARYKADGSAIKSG